MPCSTLHVANVPLDTSDENLEELFSDFGPIKRCFVVRPKLPGAKKTFGIVQFAFSDDAQKAFKVMSLLSSWLDLFRVLDLTCNTHTA